MKLITRYLILLYRIRRNFVCRFISAGKLSRQRSSCLREPKQRPMLQGPLHPTCTMLQTALTKPLIIRCFHLGYDLRPVQFGSWIWSAICPRPTRKLAWIQRRRSSSAEQKHRFMMPCKPELWCASQCLIVWGKHVENRNRRSQRIHWRRTVLQGEWFEQCHKITFSVICRKLCFCPNRKSVSDERQMISRTFYLSPLSSH